MSGLFRLIEIKGAFIGAGVSSMALLMFASGCSSLRVPATPSIITTVAGTGVEGNSGIGGTATAAQLEEPTCAVTDSSGNLYIGDAQTNTIRKVAATTGIITNFAGTGAAGYSGDGGPAIAASMYAPTGCVLDAVGDLYFSDDANNVVRKITASTGIITTVAGNGFGTQPYNEGAYAGDGGPATSAELNKPFGLVLDAAGDLFISDTSNQRVREVSASTGVITTVAGKGTYGNTGAGGLATQAEIANPEQLAVDGAGNLYIAEQGGCVIAKVNLAAGTLTIIAGNGAPGDPTGTGMYVTGDGGPALQSPLSSPQGVALNAAGNLFIADSNGARVREVNMTTGIITTVVGSTVGFAGDGGAPAKAKLHNPWGLYVDPDGDLYIADYYNGAVRKVTGLR